MSPGKVEAAFPSLGCCRIPSCGTTAFRGVPGMFFDVHLSISIPIQTQCTAAGKLFAHATGTVLFDSFLSNGKTDEEREP